MHWVSCAKLSGVSRVALHKVFTCCFQYCSKSVTTTLSRIFSCAMLSGAFLTTFYEVFTCAMLSQKYSLEKYWTRYFPAQCCLEPLGQHYTSFLPVPCYLKSVKTTLNKIFFLCDFVWSLFDKIAQGFYLCHVVSKLLRHHWTRFEQQCCLEPLGQHYTKLFVQCWPRAHIHVFAGNNLYSVLLICLSQPTLLKRITYAMLAHSPWTTLQSKISYSVVLIYVGQHCARKLPVQCWSWLTDNCS